MNEIKVDGINCDTECRYCGIDPVAMSLDCSELLDGKDSCDIIY